MTQISSQFLCRQNGNGPAIWDQQRQRKSELKSITDRDLRTRAHYARLFRRTASMALPEGLGEHELADVRILAAASPAVPGVDARFCQKVRMIAAFLYHAVSEGPPKEKELKDDLEQVRGLVVKLHARLVNLPDYTKNSLADLIEVTEAGAIDEPLNVLSGAFPPATFPPAPGGAFTPASASEEEMPKETSEPE